MYARCVDSVRTRNGKKKGEGNTQNGNKHLAWAFVEAANFALRYCAEAKRFYERKKAKTHNVVAIKALARACFHILKEKKPCDVTRCFACVSTATGKPGHGDWSDSHWV
jgi:transposase